MASVIRELAVKLGLQAEGFNKGIKDAQREAKEFEKNWKPSLTLAKDMGLAVGAAGTAIAGGMLVAAKAAVDYGDALNDARQRTGIAVEQLAKYGFAAQQSGTDVGALAIGMKGLANNMQAAAEGGKSQTEAFAAAGISTAQLAAANGDIEKVMLLVADRFASMEDGAEKSALAVDIFGKSGTALIPMLNEGSAGLKKLGDDAQRAGLVMTKEMTEASDKLNDTIGELKASVLGASISIATPLIPALQSAAQFAVEATQAVSAFIKEHETLTKVVFAVAGALSIAGTAMATTALVIPKLALLWAGLNVEIALTTGGLSAALIAIVYFRKEIAEVLTAALAGVVQAFEKFTGWAATMAEKVGADGLASKLHEASFAAGTFRLELDASVVAMRAEDKVIPQTTGLLAAQQAARDALTASVKEGKLRIEQEAEALQKSRMAFNDALLPANALERSIADLITVFGESNVILEYRDRIIASTDAQLANGFALSDTAQRHRDLALAQKAAIDTTAALTTATKSAKEAQERLNDQFAASIRPADELFKGIKNLVAAGFEHKDILAKYKDEIISTVEEQKKLGKSLDASELAWYREAKALDAVSTAAALAAAAKAAAAKPPTGYANPTPENQKDPYGGWDPLGVWQPKTPASPFSNPLTNLFTNPLTNIAPQPALPAALNLGGGGAPMGPGTGGSSWPGGWVNGIWTPPSPVPQGASSFSAPITVQNNFALNTTDPVDERLFQDKIMPWIIDSLKRGIGLEQLTGQIKSAWNGVTSTKGA